MKFRDQLMLMYCPNHGTQMTDLNMKCPRCEGEKRDAGRSNREPAVSPAQEQVLDMSVEVPLDGRKNEG